MKHPEEEGTDIKEMKMRCTIKFTLSLTWFDSRLTWTNLSDNKWLNYLDPEDISKIWIPNI